MLMGRLLDSRRPGKRFYSDGGRDVMTLLGPDNCPKVVKGNHFCFGAAVANGVQRRVHYYPKSRCWHTMRCIKFNSLFCLINGLGDRLQRS